MLLSKLNIQVIMIKERTNGGRKLNVSSKLK